MSEERPPTVGTVRRFWEANPLAGFESPVEVGSVAFFDWHDQVRRADVEPFAMHLYEFTGHAGERVLDVGCGIGWLVEHFARGGARITGLDLTRRGVSLTRRRLERRGLAGAVVQASAEALPFRDGAFAFITSAGVLHHTPDTAGAIQEIRRVLRPGGRAMISLYYRNVLLSSWLWPVTRGVVRRLFRPLPGRGSLAAADSVDDFVRIYDGDANPVGKAYDRKQLRSLLAGFRLERAEVHYFPRRFLPLVHLVPRWVHRLLDRAAGTMIYASVSRS